MFLRLMVVPVKQGNINIMKFQILIKSLPIASFALMLSLSANAQQEGQAKSGKPASHGNMEARQHDADDEMATELNLTAEQKAAFKKADDDYRNKAKSLKGDQKAEMQKLRDERRNAHRSVLNEEQAKKFDEMEAHRQQRQQEHKDQRQQGKQEHKDAKHQQKQQNKSTKDENKAIKKELKKDN